MSDTRRLYRALICIEDVRDDDTPPRVDAIIPSWSPDYVVAIPTSCIDPQILGDIRPGTYLLGEVNIGAESEDELCFENLNEIVPPPTQEDG